MGLGCVGWCMDWIFQPFQEVSFGNIATWWFVTLVAMFIVAGFLSRLGVDFGGEMMEVYEERGAMWVVITVVVLSPILEELVFRGIAHFYVGTFTALLFGSIVWALMHERRAFVVAPSIPLYVKLWSGGFWQEAILVHVIHNGLLVGILILTYPYIKDD